MFSLWKLSQTNCIGNMRNNLRSTMELICRHLIWCDKIMELLLNKPLMPFCLMSITLNCCISPDGLNIVSDALRCPQKLKMSDSTCKCVISLCHKTVQVNMSTTYQQLLRVWVSEVSSRLTGRMTVKCKCIGQASLIWKLVHLQWLTAVVLTTVCQASQVNDLQWHWCSSRP